MESVFAALHMKTRDSDGCHVGVDRGGTFDELQNHIRRDVVAERGREAEKFLERNLDAGVRIFFLQGAVGVGQDAVAEEKIHWLIEGKSTLFDEVESGEGERELKDGLHGWMGVGIEIAVEGGVRKRAGDGDFAVSVRGDSAELLLKSGLGVGDG